MRKKGLFCSGLRGSHSSFIWLLLLNSLFLSSAFLCPGTTRPISSHLSISIVPDDRPHSADTLKNDDKPQLRLSDVHTLPTVEFIDPETQCQVVLLGCFHGTESSSKDVERAVTSDTNVVALELCASRFTDLQRELFQKEEQGDGRTEQEEKPWIVAYLEMISKTIRQRGLPTGLAAAVLGGFSGIQTALSGFTPGLEFTTALERSREYNCDIILADQDVDETLRRVGSLPKISLETVLSSNRLELWQLHQETLVRAVIGDTSASSSLAGPLPQVQLPSVLLRNRAAIRDLVRLTIPPTLFFWALVYGAAALAGVDVSNTTSEAYYDAATWSEYLLHWLGSAGILASGYLGLALPAVGVILTERDEILTSGIQAACRRAGNGGRVVAVLGLLHVNGVAKHMARPPGGNSR